MVAHVDFSDALKRLCLQLPLMKTGMHASSNYLYTDQDRLECYRRVPCLWCKTSVIHNIAYIAAKPCI